MNPSKRSLPVEWPLTRCTADDIERVASACKESILVKSKRRKTEDCSPAKKLEILPLTHQETSCHQIFKSLDQEETSWLLKDVHDANKNFISVERVAEKLKEKDDVGTTKESLKSLK